MEVISSNVVVIEKGSKSFALSGFNQSNIGQELKLTLADASNFNEADLEGLEVWVTYDGSNYKYQQHFWPVKMGVIVKDAANNYKLQYDTALGMGSEFAQ